MTTEQTNLSNTRQSLKHNEYVIKTTCTNWLEH